MFRGIPFVFPKITRARISASDRACLAGPGRAALLLGMALVTSAAQAQPTLINLGTFSGTGTSEAYGLTTDGAAVVGLSGPNAFRWTSAGGMQNLGVIPGGTYSRGFAVSGDGTVVVGESNITGVGTRAFRWTSAGGMQNLGVFAGPPAGSSYAYGVSADGSAVIGYSYSNNGYRAFRWTSGGGLEDLGSLKDGGESSAFGISADGSVVVGSSPTGTTFGSNRAFRWTSAGGMQSIGTLGGDSFGEAVSADGLVAVGYCTGTGFSRAFRWSGAGGMEPLGLLPGGFNSEALAANGDGSAVVGGASIPGGLTRAFLWTQPLGMVNLHTYLAGLGVDLTDWSLEYATAISADGSVIAGRGSFRLAGRAWLVTGLPRACPSDYNGDGFVDGIDADQFNNDFESGNIAADYNGDGFVDGIDSDTFNNDFAAGC